MDADIIYIGCGLAESVREISKREEEINGISGTFEFQCRFACSWGTVG